MADYETPFGTLSVPERPPIPPERIEAFENLRLTDPDAFELACLIDPWAMKPYNGGLAVFYGPQRAAMEAARRLLDAGWQRL